MLLFFFFMQKTAYERRISDWSSDVCSSDLVFLQVAARQAGRRCPGADRPDPESLDDAGRQVSNSGLPDETVPDCGAILMRKQNILCQAQFGNSAAPQAFLGYEGHALRPAPRCRAAPYGRSEEHTSELQSL